MVQGVSCGAKTSPKRARGGALGRPTGGCMAGAGHAWLQLRLPWLPWQGPWRSASWVPSYRAEGLVTGDLHPSGRGWGERVLGVPRGAPGGGSAPVLRLQMVLRAQGVCSGWYPLPPPVSPPLNPAPSYLHPLPAPPKHVPWFPEPRNTSRK